MIALEDVSFAYGQKPVLQAVSLRFPKSGAVCLFGASGCGKTTIGELTAKKLGLKFLDTDKMVEEAEGVSIRRLFAQKGEKYFRLQETAACRAASERGGAVIATGGGVVLSRVNMSILGKTGILV